MAAKAKPAVVKDAASLNAFSARPLLIRVLLVVLGLNIICSLLFIADRGFFLFGFYLSGIVAIVLKLLLNVICGGALFAAIWNKYGWAWRYGVAYFGFLLLNGLISSAVLVMVLPAYLSKYIFWGIALVATASIALNLIMLAIMVKEKDYFEGT